MGFTFEEDEKIKGLRVINVHRFTDFRGEYKKVYEQNIYSENQIPMVFTETSEIVSNRGVLRGLHFQTHNSQAKLVHVIKGKIYDVAVDLRPDSETFGQWKGYLLTEGDGKSVLVPEDFAHGFLVLEDNTIFTYQCSGKYEPEYCGGIRWDDPALNIPWPLGDLEEPILSDKDKYSNMTVEEYRKKYIG